MSPQDRPRRDFVGRGLLLVDDFCRITGADRAAVEALVADGRVEGATDGNGRAFGLFDDVLPTREQLEDWGLVVGTDYVPERLRSHANEVVEDDDDEAEDNGPTWTMSWPDSP